MCMSSEIIIIIIWSGDTVTVTHLQNVIQTQKCEPCQLNKPTTPFPAGGLPPDMERLEGDQNFVHVFRKNRRRSQTSGKSRRRGGSE